MNSLSKQESKLVKAYAVEIASHKAEIKKLESKLSALTNEPVTNAVKNKVQNPVKQKTGKKSALGTLKVKLGQAIRWKKTEEEAKLKKMIKTLEKVEANKAKGK